MRLGPGALLIASLALASHAAVGQAASPLLTEAFIPLRQPSQGTTVGPRLAVGRRPPPKHHGKDVAAMYRDAMTFYNKGQYPLAAQAFGRILQRFPGHDPSRLQLAKTFYRMGKTRDAYAIFKQMAPQYLDPETSYEYAQSHLQQNDLEKALFAFKRVPKDHPLHDLACYYGAIAAFRLKRYQEADDLIDDAVVLPNKLTKSRNLYKKNISELRVREQEETLAREKAQEIQRMKSETKSFNENLTKDKRDKDSPSTGNTRATPAEPPYRGFQEFGTEARAGGETKSLQVTRPTTEDHLLVNRTFFHFITTPHLRFGKPSTLPGALGGRLDLRLEDRYFEGMEQTANASDDEEATSYLYRDKHGNDKFGKARGSVWVEAPVGPLLSGAEGAYYLAVRDFKSSTSVNNASAQVFVGNRGKAWQWRLLGGFIQTQADKKKLRQTTLGRLEGEWGFRDAIALYGHLEGRQFHYDDATLPGPDTNGRALAGIKALLPWQISLGAEAAYLYDKDYRVHDVVPGGDVVFDADTIYSRVYLDAKPFSWFGLQAYATRADHQLTRFSAPDEEAVAAVKETQYNLLSELVLTAYINLLF